MAIETAIQSFRDAENLSKTLHQRVVTAVEFFMPQLKGALKSSREAVKGHLQREPTRHTVASTSRIVFLFSCTLSSVGKARVGIGLILQCQSGLRADELFDLRKCDFHDHHRAHWLLAALGFRWWRLTSSLGLKLTKIWAEVALPSTRLAIDWIMQFVLIGARF